MRLVAGFTVEAQYAPNDTVCPRLRTTRLSNSGPSNPALDARLSSAKARSSSRAEISRITFSRLPSGRLSRLYPPRLGPSVSRRRATSTQLKDAFVTITMVARDVADGIARTGDCARQMEPSTDDTAPKNGR